jgi:hypothetical protein
MKLHTINWVKPLDASRLQVFFDDGSGPVIDLSPMLAQGGVFRSLRDPARFAAVEVGPRGRTLLWHIPLWHDPAAFGEGVVDLCADALWLMVHPEDRSTVAAEEHRAD